MNKIDGTWRFFLGGLYTWVVSAYFGAILLDIVYANLALNLIDSRETGTLFSEVSDFLLFISIFPILAAIGAIGSSWSIKTARNLFIASTLIVLIGFLAPPMLFPLILNLQANLGINVGPWVRLVGSALPSILAFVGLWKLYPSQS
jgi:hypothetical protein